METNMVITWTVECRTFIQRCNVTYIFECTWYVRRLCTKVLDKQIWVQALSCKFLPFEIQVVQDSDIRTVHDFIVILMSRVLPLCKVVNFNLKRESMSPLGTPGGIFPLFISQFTANLVKVQQKLQWVKRPLKFGSFFSDETPGFTHSTWYQNKY